MSSSLRRGALAATTLALAAVSLTACGAGNDAQTLEVKPDNAATHVGVIKVQNANIVTDTKGSGEATVTARIFNDGDRDQTLKGIRVDGARAELSPAKGEKKLVVPAGGSLALGGKGNASALLQDVEAAGVKDGNAQPVTFDLSRTGAVKLRATVLPAKHAFETVGPSSSPSDSAPRPGSSASPGQDGAESPSDDASTGASADEQGAGASEGATSPSSSPGTEQGGESAGD
ncbi:MULTISPECIES: hypothetical protein [Streptomyces]|uniref:DUF461 domain-containing protein n=1 Tax=Streptomyces qinglanensis TaxID=943816 RepID=A0A1E7JZT3_9ACTN|nr:MULTISPECIES: hypothetical protein [Streptomyces]MBE9498552.1 DUF461 domain-containing protein [Streptomyces sp. GKU 257-1]OEU97181.1 hypothetical protein AN217_04015 [Streptomyces qinglanensis]OEV24282.1 hypothetical protein AN220_19970 [Streptomyces nanshensis]OEV24283.1 hypothetical protein AN220_19980 [Streptomyces nanshensis]